MEFGILNQSPLLDDHTTVSSLADTVGMAVRADQLGYRRFFLSEHHNDDSLAGTAPEIMIPHLLAHTEHIHVGSGGVMLQHYNPFKVAEQFQLMQHLGGGRVDLGVGKAPGGLALSTQALQHGLDPEKIDFNSKFQTLKNFLNHSHTGEWKELKTSPDTSNPPELFLLGSSPSSARFAAEEGVNFIYAHFITNNEEQLEEAVNGYGGQNPDGRLIVALSVLVTEDSEVQDKVLKENRIHKLTFQSGKVLRVNGAQKAQKVLDSAEEPVEVEAIEPQVIMGARSEVLGQLEKLTAELDIDELMFHLPSTDADVRNHTIEALSPLHTIHNRQHAAN